MWQITQLDPGTGAWSTGEAFASLDESRSRGTALAGEGGDVFYFWTGDIPDDMREQARIFDQEFEANQGRLVRVTVGIEPARPDSARTASSCGRCFCVIYANGRRQCEYYYCSMGFCRWVVCSTGC